jgi:mutator protein MutT
MQHETGTSRVDVAIALIVRDERLLICRRRAGSPLEGYWEFPGGKCTQGELPEQCVTREVREEIGLHVSIERELSVIDHDYAHGRVRLHPFICRIESGQPSAIACDELRWVSAADLPTYRFPPANDGLLIEATAVLSTMRRSDSG